MLAENGLGCNPRLLLTSSKGAGQKSGNHSDTPKPLIPSFSPSDGEKVPARADEGFPGICRAPAKQIRDILSIILSNG
jgi:hypothetical protein